jgi:hypothetical protein
MAGTGKFGESGGRPMNCAFFSPLRRRALLAVAALCMMAMTGCLEQLLVWSPDGQRAVVLAQGKLYLTDASGKLSPELAANVTRVAWLNDSQRLVLATAEGISEWKAIVQEIGPAKEQEISAAAEAVWKNLQAGTPWKEAEKQSEVHDSDVLCIYLRERHGNELPSKVDAEAWEQIKKSEAALCRLVAARIEGGKIALGAVLHHGLGQYKEIRPAADGKAVAFVVEEPLVQNECYRLLVTSLEAPQPIEVARNVAFSPDWTPDGQALAYLQAAAGQSEGKTPLPVLGTLVLQKVISADGKIAAETNPESLAGCIFSVEMRVRCLRDGRILFNAVEFSLPIAKADFGGEHDQLFAIDPKRQSTLARLIPRRDEHQLPKGLAFFEVSPDERRVLFGTYKGAVSVLTLESGAVQQIQPAGEDLQGAPQWRNADEFSYVRRRQAKPGEKPEREWDLVLRRGEQETVLSRGWPAEWMRKE